MAPQAITETIRAAAEITAVIGEYVPLRPGGLNMVGLCPFHDERTPSFQVSRAKQVFTCRGCGVGGDVFRFIEKIEGVGFTRARRILAERYGIELEPRGPRLDYATVRRQRAAAEALAAECDWYWRSVRMAYVRRENAMWWLVRVAERILIADGDGAWEGTMLRYERRGWRWRRIIERLDGTKDEILMDKFMRARNRPAVKREWAAEQRVNAVIAAVFGEAA